MEKTIIYTKRSSSEAKVLRKEFNSSVRKKYLKNITLDDNAIKEFKAAGLTDKTIEKMKHGVVPNGYEVHHKLPLDDSGTNDYGNLILIKTEPYHRVITNSQLAFSLNMKVGESVKVKFPMPEGNIYPK